MENLITLIVDLISALLGRSKEEKKQAPPQPLNRPEPSRPRPQARPSSWEDELRRLLEGQGQGQAAPPPQRSPPVVAPQLPRAQQAPSAQPPPRVVTSQRPVPVLIESPASVIPNRPRPVLEPPPLPPGIQMGNRELASLSESKQAYARASQLDKVAAAQIERVPGQHVQNTKVFRRAVSPEVSEAVSLFKSVRGVRQAVIVSTVFGPPRAFGEQTSVNF